MASKVLGRTFNHFNVFGSAVLGDTDVEYADSNNDAVLSDELRKAQENVNNLASKVQKEQESSIHISMNELVIRANNIFEFLIKKSKVEERIKGLIEKIAPKTQDLPKKGFVKQAEETHIDVDSRKAIEDARARGGEVRERKGR